MLQRLKNALDSQIQQEQARSRARNTTPSSLSREEKIKDPSEFDPEIDLGSLAPSRAGTPVQSEPVLGDDPLGGAGEKMGNEEKNTLSPSSANSSTTTLVPGNGTAATAAAGGNGGTLTMAELPTEVRVKLRKFEKIEGRYNDLLRSYKTIYARNSLIGPFEKVLRENTTCESIADPKTLIDYINNFSLRADLSREELVRVSKERDETKAQLQKFKDEQQKEVDAKDEEIKNLKEKVAELEKSSGATNSPKPTGLGISSLRKDSEKDSGDFFSYENEQEVEINTLRAELQISKESQKVAGEAVESMQKSVEDAQTELEGLRETGNLKDQEIRELRAKNEGLTKEIQESGGLKTKNEDLAKKLSEVEKAAEKANKEIQAKSTELSKKTIELEEKKKETEVTAEMLNGFKKDAESRTDNLKSLKKQVAEKQRKNEELEREVREIGEKMKTLIMHSKELDNLRRTIGRLEGKLKEAERPSTEPTAINTAPEAAKENAPSISAPTTPAKKKNNKKKKGKGKGSQPTAVSTEETLVKDTETIEDEPEQATITYTSESIIIDLQNQLSSLQAQLEEKEAHISKLQKKASNEESLKEEIESLRDDIIDIGQDHVQAKESLKKHIEELAEVRAQKELLEQKVQDFEADIARLNSAHAERVNTLESDMESLKSTLSKSSASTEMAYETLKSDYETLKQKSSTLETDLSAAQKLAATRYKDLTELRQVIEKAQPELTSLRAEVATLAAGRNEANQKLVELKKLERVERDLRNEITVLNKKISDKENEFQTSKSKIREEATRRVKAEEATRAIQKDLKSLEHERKEVSETAEKNSRDHVRALEELNSLKPKLAAHEKEITGLKNERDDLKEELDLKTAQHKSAESLMSSMRDQTNEMAMQMKESQEKCDSYEEELSESHRLLTERSREAETMRNLLQEVESRHEARLCEMKARMEAAFDERDKAEEESATVGRRRAREIEDLRDRVRDAERGLKKADDAREAAEREATGLRDGKTRVEETLERIQREYEDTKRAMGSMRDALDQTDAQIADMERQKTELRNQLGETQTRYEKLQKSHRTLQDELRTLQITRPKLTDEPTDEPTRNSSIRSSIDSNSSSSRLSSSRGGGAGGDPTGKDLVNLEYLKNFLLQFLEKDQKTKMQLIPVLGMLLKFDRKDEGKWRKMVESH